jgi:hypothetical protein
MKDFLNHLVTFFDETVIAGIPAFAGGIVDYLNQLQKGTKKWSCFSFMTHVSSALFFGWVCGSIASGMNYSVDIVASSGGMGGFLGVRVADLLSYKVFGDRRNV